ncbi:MAG: hypothetical protein II748_01340, partial [Clostridia bacterium]|nr:hypothetical protein [Clostridia bacterium]
MKRLMAMLLAIVVMLGCMPLGAFAREAGNSSSGTARSGELTVTPKEQSRNTTSQEKGDDHNDGLSEGEQPDVELVSIPDTMAMLAATRNGAKSGGDSFTATVDFVSAPNPSNDQWELEEGGTSAKVLAGRAFYLQILVTNGTRLAHSKEFVITGDYLDTVQFPKFNDSDGHEQLDTPIIIYTPEGMPDLHYMGTLSKTYDDDGNITSIKIKVDVPDIPEDASDFAQILLAASFKPHSNSGRVELDPDDSVAGAVVQVKEKVNNPTLGFTTNTIAKHSSNSSAIFYQWMPDRNSLKFTATTTPKITSSNASPYLQDITVTQT